MASTSGPISKGLGGCLGFVILGAIIVAGGSTISLIVGGLLVLGGFSQLGDGRRNPFTGFGAMAFGFILCVVGFGMWATKKSPNPEPQDVASQVPAGAESKKNGASAAQSVVGAMLKRKERIHKSPRRLKRRMNLTGTKRKRRKRHARTPKPFAASNKKMRRRCGPSSSRN